LTQFFETNTSIKGKKSGSVGAVASWNQLNESELVLFRFSKKRIGFTNFVCLWPEIGQYSLWYCWKMRKKKLLYGREGESVWRENWKLKRIGRRDRRICSVGTDLLLQLLSFLLSHVKHQMYGTWQVLKIRVSM